MQQFMQASTTTANIEKRDVTADDAEIYEHAAVAADTVTCSEIGVEILQRNGSVVDSAVASCFCLSVINMHSSGPGGGGVMLVYIRENKTFETFSYRERAPLSATEELLKSRSNETLRGALSVAVPGEIRGLHAAWKKYGKLPWRDLIQPTIDMTENGFRIQLRLYEAANTFREIIEADEGFSKLMIRNGTLKNLGEKLTMPDYTKMLRKIQEDPEDFYQGSIAREVVEDVQSHGGIITLEDLKNYKVQTPDVLSHRIGNYTFNTATSPFGGPIVIHVLNILSGYNFTKDDFSSDEKSLQTYQRIAEAFKFAYAQRTQEGDPDFLEAELVKKFLQNVTSDEISKYVRSMITENSTHPVDYYGPVMAQPLEEGTTHVSIIGPNGDAVSVTGTINEWFGGGFRSKTNGIIYNNEMADFGLPGHSGHEFPAAPANALKPGKIPLSASTPMIVTDDNGDVKMVLGASGGPRIITAVTWVILNKLWFGDELGHAVSKPRFYHQLIPNHVTMEEKIPMSQKVIDGLRRLGHEIDFNDRPEFSSVQAIYVENKTRIFAKSDPRKYGHTAGF
eukprot:gene15371-6603_t